MWQFYNHRENGLITDDADCLDSRGVQAVVEDGDETHQEPQPRFRRRSMHSAWYFNRCTSLLQEDRDAPQRRRSVNGRDSRPKVTENGDIVRSMSYPPTMTSSAESPSLSSGNSPAHHPTTPLPINRSNSCPPDDPGQTLLSPNAKPDDIQLLVKLQEANRQLEQDRKSLQSLSPGTSRGRHALTNGQNGHSEHGHSRQGSVSSVMSSNSVCSNASGYEETGDDLWSLWGKLVNEWEMVVRKRPGQIKDLVRRGIPHHFRGLAWQLMCEAYCSDAKERYAEYLKMTSPCEKVIRRDITRTYPEHDFFKEKDGLGQESLFNVMKAYSLQDREVGYCQGSAFIVGLLLMQMPEEEAFAVLVKIMQEYRLRELFKPSMAELGLCMFQLECMIQDQLPALYSHFGTQGFCVSMFASSWFLTLFATSLPLSIACRIFDVFLLEGIEMIFRIGFAILQMSYHELLLMDMEGMIKHLQKDMPLVIEQDPESLFTAAYQVKYNAKKMKKLEKEYNALKSKEQEEQVELRRLRTENRLLRQRIDNLEKETATLADRLIQDQVKYAQQEEEIYVLRRDLSAARQRDHSSNQRLREATAQLEQYRRSNSCVSNDSGVDVHGAAPSQTSVCVEQPGEAASSQEDPAGDEKVQQLEQQLSEMRTKEVEVQCTVRELRERVRDVEHTNQQLRRDPDAELQNLQEELIACKLREAEATLSMKELKHKVNDLDKFWQKHMEKQTLDTPKKASKNQVQQLQDDMMTLRLREAQTLGELKELKQKVMELETENHICNRHNKRLEEEADRHQGEVDSTQQHVKDLLNQIRDLERREADQEGKKKEERMMSRIRDAEHTQAMAEMRQRVAELEIQNQELMTKGQLQDKGEKQDLINRIADYQEEVLQLKMARRIQSLSSLALNQAGASTESDYDTDEMERTVNDSRLQLTTSMGGEDLAAVLRPRPTELDSSDSEGVDDMAKRKVARRKKRVSSIRKDGVDLDKTPTQEMINSDLFGIVQNGISAAEIDLDSVGADDHSDSVPSAHSSQGSEQDANVTHTNGHSS